MSSLPTGWIRTTLGTVADLLGGSTPKGVLTASPGAVPFYKVSDMNASDGHVMADSRVTVSEEIAASLRLRICPPGSVIFPKVGGALRTNKKRILARRAAFDTNTMAAVPTTAVHPMFLFYWLSRLTLADFAYGAPVPQLSRARLGQELLALPPAAEQARIVAAIEEQFSRLDAGVTALERARANLKRMQTAVLHAATTGELLGEGQADWETVCLGDVLIDIQAGRSFKCEERPATDSEWGVVKVSAMTWGEFREGENKTVLPDREIDSRMEIRPGDVLLSRANTVEYVGAIVRVRECRPRLLLSDKSLRLVPKPRVLPEWLVISVRSDPARRYIEAVATGTSDSMRNISQPKLRALEVPLPPIETQRALTREVERQFSLLETELAALASARRRAGRLRNSILAAAFAGNLVEHDPDDEPASVLLERIAAARASSGADGKSGERRARKGVAA